MMKKSLKKGKSSLRSINIVESKTETENKEICKLRRFGVKNTDQLIEIYQYQNTHIEHRFPKYISFASTWLEAIGDILRDLSGTSEGEVSEIDVHYIESKIRLLRRSVGGQDELEKAEEYFEYKDKITEGYRAFSTKLMDFERFIKSKDIDNCRMEVFLNIVNLMKHITKWARYYHSTCGIIREINEFVDDLELRLPSN